jgi:hypothetical protein
MSVKKLLLPVVLGAACMLGQAADATKKAAKTVAEKTVSGAKTVASKTADGAKVVGSKTAEVTKDAAKATAKGTEKVAEKTVEVSKDAAKATKKGAEKTAEVTKDAVTKKSAPAAVAGGTASASEIASAKAKGLVWVNLDSKIYHKEGQHYGTTKNGKFMTEAEATKMGAAASKSAAAAKK